MDRALHTTMAALRAAAITSKVLRALAPPSGSRPRGVTVDAEELQQAFGDVFQAMDEIDRYKAEATVAMKQTVTVLEGQVSRARLQLERNGFSDAATANLGRSQTCRG